MNERESVEEHTDVISTRPGVNERESVEEHTDVISTRPGVNERESVEEHTDVISTRPVYMLMGCIIDEQQNTKNNQNKTNRTTRNVLYWHVNFMFCSQILLCWFKQNVFHILILFAAIGVIFRRLSVSLNPVRLDV